MVSFSWFSSPAPTPPPEDMHVVPCTGVDLANRDLVLTIGFIIDTPLDPRKLEDTLSLLVAYKFPRAGARLAMRNGIFEFHIPHEFNAETPAVAFTVEEHSEQYAFESTAPSLGHLLGRSHTSRTPWICSMPELQPFLRSSTCPASTEAFLAPNTPLARVHVTLFDDLTFLGFTSTHAAFDPLGVHALLHAWTRLLSGEALEEIPGMPWDAQPFAPFRSGTAASPPPTPGPAATGPPGHSPQRGWFELGDFAQLMFNAQFMRRVFRESSDEAKIIRIPKHFLEQRKLATNVELRGEGSGEWAGGSDVLAAWWYKLVFDRRTDDTPIHIHIPVNLRNTHIFGATDDAEISTPFINNAISSIAVPPLPANAFKTTSLTALAARIRRAITAYNADLAGITEDLRWRCAHPLAVLFPCPPNGEYVVHNSWREARFSDLDFSGALPELIGEEDEKGKGRERQAKVAFVVPVTSSGEDLPLRGSGVLLMEDEEAVWMVQVRGARDWETLKKTSGVEFI